MPDTQLRLSIQFCQAELCIPMGQAEVQLSDGDVGMVGGWGGMTGTGGAIEG